MKNSVWMGISITVLAGIVQASGDDLKDQKLLVEENGEQFEITVSINPTRDGSIILKKSDGTSLIIPKKSVDQIKSINSKSKPKFDRSTPCVAAATRGRSF